MIPTPPWYKAIADKIEPMGPLMIVIAGALAVVTAWLIWRRQWPALALWLAYLVSP